MTATIVSSAAADLPATPLFLLSIDVTAGTLAVHGDLDREHVERFLQTVDLLPYSPSRCWSIDVSAVTFCDAAGLRGLLAARRSAEQEGRDFRVIRAGRWMRRLLPMIELPTYEEPTSILRVIP
jgi:anti-anti-sigma regulatory factor